MKKLAGAVRGRRGERHQTEVAEEIGVTASTLSRIENGRFTPNLETFALICRWLGVDMDFFARKPGEEK